MHKGWLRYTNGEGHEVNYWAEAITVLPCLCGKGFIRFHNPVLGASIVCHGRPVQPLIFVTDQIAAQWERDGRAIERMLAPWAASAHGCVPPVQTEPPPPEPLVVSPPTDGEPLTLLDVMDFMLRRMPPRRK